MQRTAGATSVAIVVERLRCVMHAVPMGCGGSSHGQRKKVLWQARANASTLPAQIVVPSCRVGGAFGTHPFRNGWVPKAPPTLQLGTTICAGKVDAFALACHNTFLRCPWLLPPQPIGTACMTQRRRSTTMATEVAPAVRCIQPNCGFRRLMTQGSRPT